MSSCPISDNTLRLLMEQVHSEIGFSNASFDLEHGVNGNFRRFVTNVWHGLGLVNSQHSVADLANWTPVPSGTKEDFKRSQFGFSGCDYIRILPQANTTCPATKIFLAALRSAFSSWPQATHLVIRPKRGSKPFLQLHHNTIVAYRRPQKNSSRTLSILNRGQLSGAVVPCYI